MFAEEILAGKLVLEPAFAEEHTMSSLEAEGSPLHDMTLRDGMHPKRHLMTLEQMKDIASGLDAAGVPLIEVTHGDGLGGSSVNYGFPAHSDEEYSRAVIPLMKRAKVSALLIPGIGTVDHLKMAKASACTPSAWRRTAPRAT
jgi:4-hydroxy-2-oxovalerate/4-hydroxy-2-oxohexanoate aldolase